MSENIISCPSCDCEQVVKNGFIHNGKQNFLCKSCGRQFVLNPKNKVIEQETKDLIDKLLLEKLPLAGIARVTGVSERWLQTYVNTLYRLIPKDVEVWPKKKGG
ncbi:IS1 family transposase [Chroococcidiopsis sp. CCMEE 29]|uniref:IS1/IS1595 family N-terminal zinc-binding domain-containing protein n=1 Tax=Chroococcidiopsis sp. CCMEE 29 TaxID=155894 RepID=UPI0020224335|nr:IS1 family transposase [Chroococcidiopsis sp. CCMEE 29]